MKPQNYDSKEAEDKSADAQMCVIIGAGPAGLTAAHELLELDQSAVVLEADQQVGGISRTVEHKGFRFVVLEGDISPYNYDPESEAYKKSKAYYDAVKGPERKWWNAGISQEQIAWLKGILGKAQEAKEPTVIMCHYPIHKPIGGHSLLNSREMLTLLDAYPNVVMWLNGHNHGGGYAKVGNRHHLNLKGMQNEAENWYQMDFSSDRITVYQAENLDTPKFELDIVRPRSSTKSP